MSTAVMSSPMFECGELFKSAGAGKPKDMGPQGQAMGGGNGHAPLRRSYTSLVSLIEQHRKLDRSVSEPTSRYKTELCRPFEESGSCKYGDKCQFAHGFSELRNLARHPKYKTELCRTFHKIGFCPYGPRCHFVHNFEEARIHNIKVSSQLGHAQPAGIVGLGPLLQPGQPQLNVNVSLLEQLAASPQVAAAVAAAASAPLVRANSLTLASGHQHQHHQQQQQQQQHLYAAPPQQPLQRSNSLGLHQHQPSSSIVIGQSRPKPLNLSPTFSLGSAADSISPSSSLSQSPTNSMASFFSDEAAPGQSAATAFSFGQDFGLLTRQSPSPLEELSSPRTPSPLSPSAESRLPVFNRISSTLLDLEHLKI